MKVISMHQPWASWVALGWKTIETRTHDRFKNLVGQTIGIHAAKHWDKEWYEKASRYLNLLSRIKTTNDLIINAPRGFLIATVFVDGFRLLNGNDSGKAKCYCYDNNLYGLILSDIRRVQPIPMRGFQGIFNYDGEFIYL